MMEKLEEQEKKFELVFKEKNDDINRLRTELDHSVNQRNMR